MKPPVTRMRNMFFVVFPKTEFEYCLQTQGASKERAGYLRGKKKKKKGRVNEPRLPGRQEGMGSRAMIEEFALLQNG